METKKKQGLNTTEGLIAAWRSCHPDAVRERDESETLAEKLARLKATDIETYNKIAHALRAGQEDAE